MARDLGFFPFGVRDPGIRRRQGSASGISGVPLGKNVEAFYDLFATSAEVELLARWLNDY